MRRRVMVLVIIINHGLLKAWLVDVLSKIRVARDAHLLLNDSTGEIALTNWYSHESENIGTRPLYRILIELFWWMLLVPLGQQ